MSAPIWINEKKLVFVNEQNTVKVGLQASLNQKLSFAKFEGKHQCGAASTVISKYLKYYTPSLF